MVQLHWRLLQRRLQLVPTQELLCSDWMLLKNLHPACCILMMLSSVVPASLTSLTSNILTKKSPVDPYLFIELKSAATLKMKCNFLNSNQSLPIELRGSCRQFVVSSSFCHWL